MLTVPFTTHRVRPHVSAKGFPADWGRWVEDFWNPSSPVVKYWADCRIAAYLRSLWDTRHADWCSNAGHELRHYQLLTLTGEVYDLALNPGTVLTTAVYTFDVAELHTHAMSEFVERTFHNMVMDLYRGVYDRLWHHWPTITVRAPELTVHHEAYQMRFWLWSRVRTAEVTRDR